jgi:hypothetical protein
MTVASGPVFSPREIPFSFRGSWFCLSPVVAEQTYAEDVHLVSHQTGMHPILRLIPSTGGARAETIVTATPDRITWACDTGRIDLAYENPDTVRLRGLGLGLRLLAADPVLTPFSGPYFYQDPADGSFVFTVYQTGRRYRVTLLTGRIAGHMGVEALGTAERGLVISGDAISGDAEPWEIVVEEYETARAPYRSRNDFDHVASAALAEFEEFRDAVAPWRGDRTPAADLAAYVLWSATVRAAGFVTRPAVLMSKHWMNKVWSWDHCFNAIALAAGLPNLARDQFHLPFDHQDAAGALPDSITHSEILYNYVKPPIHGWALRHLPPASRPAEIYRLLERWTTFWLDARRVPGHELAHYQHGNDSGWDNATTFDPGRVVETADLAAFLVLQMRELARLAPDPATAGSWTEQADRMREALLAELWTGDRFVARSAHTGSTWSSSSLLDLMPIVLGEELPESVSATLAARIERHLTAFGPATESPDSEHYQDDGYWRGPIWAPSTVLIEDGLRRAGHLDLADEISARFRALCEKSGFAENFDARTGEGLRDRAYTWTAAAYLILSAAHELRQQAMTAAAT